MPNSIRALVNSFSFVTDGEVPGLSSLSDEVTAIFRVNGDTLLNMSTGSPDAVTFIYFGATEAEPGPISGDFKILLRIDRYGGDGNNRLRLRINRVAGSVETRTPRALESEIGAGCVSGTPTHAGNYGIV